MGLYGVFLTGLLLCLQFIHLRAFLPDSTTSTETLESALYDTAHEIRYNGIDEHSSLKYFAEECSPETDNQPQGLCANITKKVVDARIGTGTRSGTKYTPPGFDEVNKHCGRRGHLLATVLGGTGRDVRNIVSLYHRANNPLMLDWEALTRDVLRRKILPKRDSNNRERKVAYVDYKVRVEYSRGQQHPEAIRITAYVVFEDGTRAFWYDVKIPNDYRATRRDVVVFRDETSNLFDHAGFDPNKAIDVTKGAGEEPGPSGRGGKALLKTLQGLFIVGCACKAFSAIDI